MRGGRAELSASCVRVDELRVLGEQVHEHARGRLFVLLCGGQRTLARRVQLLKLVHEAPLVVGAVIVIKLRTVVGGSASPVSSRSL